MDGPSADGGRREASSTLQERVVLAFVALAAAAFIALHALDDAPLEDPLSAYALGNQDHVWLFALLMLAAGIFLEGMRRWRLRRSRGDASLIVAGAALVLVAVFPTDPWYPWEAMPTPVGFIHVLAAFVAFSAFGISAITNPPRSTTRLLAIAYAALLVGSFAGVVICIVFDWKARFVGVAERAMLLAALAWMTVSVREFTASAGRT